MSRVILALARVLFCTFMWALTFTWALVGSCLTRSHAITVAVDVLDVYKMYTVGSIYYADCRTVPGRDCLSLYYPYETFSQVMVPGHRLLVDVDYEELDFPDDVDPTVVCMVKEVIASIPPDLRADLELETSMYDFIGRVPLSLSERILVWCLGSSTYTIRAGATTLLKDMGVSAHRLLLYGLHDRDPEVRWRCRMLRNFLLCRT